MAMSMDDGFALPMGRKIVGLRSEELAKQVSLDFEFWLGRLAKQVGHIIAKDRKKAAGFDSR